MSVAATVLTNPMTWQLVGAGAGLLSAAGAKQTGQQQQAAYGLNAQNYEQQAQETRTASSLNEYQKRKQIAAVIGSQQAAYSSRGVVTTTGSPVDVMVESLANGYQDIAIDNYNYEVSARKLDYEADLQRYYGDQAKEAGDTNSSISILKTVASVGTAFAGAKSLIGS